jgi:hypothetical protein
MLRALFRRLDPLLWRESGYNPVVLLGRVPQATLDRAGADPRYLTLYTQACERYDALIQPVPAKSDTLIAYFSAEYGLTECLPIYSGGWGFFRGSSQVSQRLRHPASRRGAALSGRLLPPVFESGRLATGTVSNQRFLYAAGLAGTRFGGKQYQGSGEAADRTGLDTGLAHPSGGA